MASKKRKYKRDELLRVALHIYQHVDTHETNGEMRAINVTEAAAWLLRSVDATAAGRPLDEYEDNDDA